MMPRSLRYYIDLIEILTIKELKVRYKRSFLGYLWSVCNPLVLAIIFYVAFKIVVKIPIENYTLFLISGLFPWQWFSNSINISTQAFIGNASLIKKIGMRREILVVTIILNDMIHYILSIPVILLFLFYYNHIPKTSWILGIPLFLVIQFIFIYGICLIFASLNVFFRDIERLLQILTIILFYFTPIIYSEQLLPEKYKFFILKLNPLSPLILCWRELFINGTILYKNVLLASIYSCVFFILGYIVFKNLQWKFAEVI